VSKSRIDLPEDEAGERLMQQLEVLAGVATKAIAMKKWDEAERLLSSVTADFVSFVERASNSDEWENVARMHPVLAEILPKLEAATGEPWMQCLDVAAVRRDKPRPPPRGQA
jgi:hypothetical protein